MRVGVGCCVDGGNGAGYIPLKYNTSQLRALALALALGFRIQLPPHAELVVLGSNRCATVPVDITN